MARYVIRAAFVLAAAATLCLAIFGTWLWLSGGRPLADVHRNGLGVAVPGAVVSLLVAWQQRRNRLAWLIAFAAFCFSVALFAQTLLLDAAMPPAIQRIAYVALWSTAAPLAIAWFLFLLLFPDGRFHRPVWRVVATILAVVSSAVVLAEFLTAPPGALPGDASVAGPSWLAGPFSTQLGLPLADIFHATFALSAAAGFIGLVDRYRFSVPTVRQQIKWVVYTVGVDIAIRIAFLALAPFGLREPELVRLAIVPLPLLGVTLAIFKYRLWSVDRLILRSVVFAVLWTAVTITVVAVALLAGVTLGGTDARTAAATAVGALIVVVIAPLRRRLEDAIARLVYGERVTGYGAVVALERDLGRVPADDLAGLLARRVKDALGAPWAAVYVAVRAQESVALRLAALAADDGQAAPELATDLVLPNPSNADEIVARIREDVPSRVGVVALEAAGEAVGVLVCAPRDEARVDSELLSAIATSAGLALRNAHLEAELRRYVSQLEDSRRRLVHVQDEERRRLERDLHDGAQQALVLLASDLKRAALGSPDRARFERLAAQAEDAVFALQDLARGIYPSVLVDRGLGAALRAHANRVPVHVRVEIDPELVERRFDGAIEAGLYFVALEAITNAQKHAGAAANIAVALRSASEGRSLVLSVHDDGHGIDALRKGTGRGLQNMSDRVAALGGSLAIKSRPGAGTWVEAVLPLQASVTALHGAGTLSQR